MGLYPSATLYYGIYLGCPDEDDMPEWAESDDPYEELDNLLEGLKVGHDTFGHYDYRRYVVCTRTLHCYAYNDLTVDPAKLQTTREEAALLVAAWHRLGMTGDVPEPRWFLTTSYS